MKFGLPTQWKYYLRVSHSFLIKTKEWLKYTVGKHHLKRNKLKLSHYFIMATTILYLLIGFLISSNSFDDHATVTAYTSRVEETDDTPYTTADGTDLKRVNHCVIASNDYDFGTVIEIEGIGECIVADRMAKRYTGKNRIDLYMGDDLDGAIEFGKKKLKIQVK